MSKKHQAGIGIIGGTGLYDPNFSKIFEKLRLILNTEKLLIW